jgi:D-lactate dehydrogenase
MRVAIFSARPYDRDFLEPANVEHGHELTFLEPRLTRRTAVLAEGHEAVSAFVNDDLGRASLEALAGAGVRHVALRSAGFNHVDLDAAAGLGLTVTYVPRYSPHAVAEHAVGLVLALNRKIHRAHARVREGNFALTGLLGVDLHGRTVGVIGTGAIGEVFARIMGAGFGCRLLVHDPAPREPVRALGARYVELPELLEGSDIISLHCPLTPATHHMIDAAAVARMRPGVMLINTSRGGLVDTVAVIDGLKSGRIGHLGIDVYEEEAGLFFEDRSDLVITDDVFSRLLTFPNVIVTGHQGFFTEEALAEIAATTLRNLTLLERGLPGALLVGSAPREPLRR